MTGLIALETNSTATTNTSTPRIGSSSAARAGPAQPACCTVKGVFGHAPGQKCHATLKQQSKTEVLTVTEITKVPTEVTYCTSCQDLYTCASHDC